jgi:hypothetical protein
MLELIYGELAASARAEVEAHVAGCAACRAELKALESTRALARQAMAADAPPPRVRAAILQAATAALPARARASKAAPQTSRPSAWAWLRGKWTLPTFATIGAVAVFLLASRIFLEPDKAYQRGRQGLVPAERSAEPTPLPASPAARSPLPGAATGAAPNGAREATGVAATSAAEKTKKRSPAAARSRREQLAQPEPPEPTEAPKAEAERPPAFAAPPAAAAAHDERRKTVYDDDLEQSDRPSSSRASGGGTAEGRAKKAEAAGADNFAGPGLGTAASSPAARPAAALGGHESAPARADRLFAQRRWIEAAVAYRELLRDNPRSPEIARWRQRLAACDAAAGNQ